MNETREAAAHSSATWPIRWAVLLSGLFLAVALGRGCVSAFWRTVFLVPRVSGAVTVAGKPIAGAKVSWYGRGWGFAPEWTVLGQASTDTSGRFTIASQTHRRVWLPIPGDPLTAWRMKVKGAGPRVAIWEEHMIALGAPAWIQVECDFSQERACRVVSSADPRVAERAEFEYAAADGAAQRWAAPAESRKEDAQ